MSVGPVMRTSRNCGKGNVGAIERKHVTICASANSDSQYNSSKGSFFIVLTVIVDAMYHHRTINVGEYGQKKKKNSNGIAFHSIVKPSSSIWCTSSWSCRIYTLCFRGRGSLSFCGGTWWVRSWGATYQQSSSRVISSCRKLGGSWSVPSRSRLHSGGFTGESLKCLLMLPEAVVKATCILHDFIKWHSGASSWDAGYHPGWQQQCVHCQLSLLSMSSVRR